MRRSYVMSDPRPPAKILAKRRIIQKARLRYCAGTRCSRSFLTCEKIE